MRKLRRAYRELETRRRELDETWRVMLSLLEDTDEAKRGLEQALKELKTLDRLKTDFMRVTTHELKTPLSHVIGHLEILRASEASLPPAARKALEAAYRGALRERELIDDILDITKLESRTMRFEMEPVKLTDLIRDSVKEARPFARQKGIALKAKLQPKLPLVKGDPRRLTQVLTNLIDNAIKFTDRGGVTVEARAEGGNVVVEVHDTGIGIAKRHMPKLFTKFFQADVSVRRKYGGTGLGLAICKGIVRVHRGRVWARSKLGRGSTFGFSIPAQK